MVGSAEKLDAMASAFWISRSFGYSLESSSSLKALQEPINAHETEKALLVHRPAVTRKWGTCGEGCAVCQPKHDVSVRCLFETEKGI